MIKNLVSDNDLNKYIEFYNNIENKENIFYMFFTSNLLHYVIESSKWIPDDVNLIFIGSNLSRDEVCLIKNYFNRPACFLDGKYKDGPIWEMITQHSKYNFGWLDIDCFIFNPKIFYEMTDIDNDVSINTIWTRNYTYEYGIDMQFACTFIEFLNINIVKEIQNKYETVMQVVRYPGEFGNAIMTEKQYDDLKLMYPEIEKRNWKYIDTTHYYQLLAFKENYRINRIREQGFIDNYYSSEAIHLSEATYIHNNMLYNGVSKIYRRFNKRLSYYLLNKYLDVLPEQYKCFKEQFKDNMITNNIDPDIMKIKENIKSYLLRQGLDINIFT